MSQQINNDKTKIVTKETLGITLSVFSFIVYVMIVTRKIIFGQIGIAVCDFIYGSIGFLCHPLFIFLFAFGICVSFGKKLSVRPSLFIFSSLFAFFLCLIIHGVTASFVSLDDFSSYVTGCYNSAQNGLLSSTFGGALLAVFVYPLVRYLSYVGFYIVCSIFALAFLFLAVCNKLNILNIFRYAPKKKNKQVEKKVNRTVVKTENKIREGILPERTQSEIDVGAERIVSNKTLSSGNGEEHKSVVSRMFNIPEKSENDTKFYKTGKDGEFSNHVVGNESVFQPAPIRERSSQSDILVVDDEYYHDYLNNGIYNSESRFNKPQGDARDGYLSSLGVEWGENQKGSLYPDAFATSSLGRERSSYVNDYSEEKNNNHTNYSKPVVNGSERVVEQPAKILVEEKYNTDSYSDREKSANEGVVFGNSSLNDNNSKEEYREVPHEVAAAFFTKVPDDAT